MTHSKHRLIGVAMLVICGAAAAAQPCHDYEQGIRWLDSEPVHNLYSAQDIVLVDHLAYVAADDGGLRRFDVQDPADILDDTGAIQLSGRARYITRVDGHLYVLSMVPDVLRVFELQEPASTWPVLTESIALPGWPERLEHHAGHLYVCGGSGLGVYDLADPAHPTLAAQLADLPGVPMDIDFLGDLAYLAVGAGLVVIDVSTPAAPVQLGPLHPGPGLAVGVVVDHVYLGGADTELVIFDLTDPTAPLPVQTLGFGPGDIRSFDSLGTTVVAGTGGLLLLDATDPAAPVFAGHYSGSDPMYGYEAGGEVLHVANGRTGLTCLDVGDPRAFAAAGSFARETASMAPAAGYLYLFEPGNGMDIPDELHVVDWSDPAAPTIVATQEWGPYPRCVDGAHLYANWYNVVRVLSLTDPEAPVQVAEYSGSGHGGYQSLMVRGDLLLAPYNSGGGSAAGFDVLDCADPLNLARLGGLELPAEPSCADLFESTAVIGMRDDGVAFCDLSDPAAPVLGDVLAADGWAYDAAVAKGYAYLTSGDQGLRIYDLADLADVIEVDQLETPGKAYTCLVDGSTLYLGTISGLHAYDLAAPAEPRYLGVVQAGYGASIELDLAGDYLVGYSGLGVGFWLPHCTDAVGILDEPAKPGDARDLPEIARLLGAIPNPFNPQTSVTFALAASRPVRLAIHDVRGREVAILADRIFAAGEHALTWNGRDQAGRDLASGVYVARLDTPDAVRTAKLVLVR